MATFTEFGNGGLVTMASASYGVTSNYTTSIDVECSGLGFTEVTHWSSSVEITDHGFYFIAKSTGVPSHDTNNASQGWSGFPNNDNPNSIESKDYNFRISKFPKIAESAYTLPFGPIGLAINGVPFYNPLNKDGQDVSINEIPDDCNGHPDEHGAYHYHKNPVCIYTDDPNDHSPLIGYAFDGFPIYGPRDENGVILQSLNLDGSHGHSDDLRGYHYHVTSDFPYILGSYKGTPDVVNFSEPPKPPTPAEVVCPITRTIFPPIPAYPKKIDSDRTLYLVYNTTETKLCKDNAPWADEVSIVPVGINENELWSDNGFANIEGELFYYDCVEKNINGKVVKLKGCVRNIGGTETKFNSKGTWVRSYVVAEHHNQLLDVILKIEDFVGINFDLRQPTLDWRIRNLEELAVIFDECPDVNFTFNVIENNKETGILAEYLIEVIGTANSFRLDFGDGSFTTTELIGQHRYGVNDFVDPVLTISNPDCQLVVTPPERENPAEPVAIIEEAFEIEFPEIPPFPNFTLVPCDPGEPDLNVPPIVFPCISLEGQIGPLPSVITGPTIIMVSNVLITGPDYPVQILHSTVEIIGDVNIPSIIIIDPPTIIVEDDIPPTIVIVPPESDIIINLALDGNLPMLEVDWGNPPEMEVALTMSRPVMNPRRFNDDEDLKKEFGEEFADLFGVSDQIKVEYEPIGIPSEIKIVPPDPSDFKVDFSDMPSEIKVNTKDLNIPSEIKISGPEETIPDTINIIGGSLPDKIEIVGNEIPDSIKLEGIEIPSKIDIELSSEIPNKIKLEAVTPIPERIILDASSLPDKIEVIGIPDQIEIIGFPDSIPLTLPENPEVELVYRGSPIEVKVNMDEMLSKDEEGHNCVMITPCPRT